MGTGTPPARSLLVFGDPEELAAYRSVIDAYEKTEGGDSIELIEASDHTDLIARP